MANFTSPLIIGPNGSVITGFPGALFGWPCYDPTCLGGMGGGGGYCPCPIWVFPPSAGGAAGGGAAGTGGISPPAPAPPLPPPPPPPPLPPPPPPPPPPLPPPPPQCQISASVGAGYSSPFNPPLPQGTVVLDTDTAALFTESYPYYVTNLPNGAQLGFIDLTGFGHPPGDAWQYMGSATTAALMASGCNIYGLPPQPPPPPPPLPPESCAGFTWVAGIPLVGSKPWCAFQDTAIAGVKNVGQRILRAIIDGADKAEEILWPWANVNIGQSAGNTDQGIMGGILSGIGITDTLDFLRGLFSGIWDTIRYALGNLGFAALRGLRFLACGLLGATTDPNYIDVATYGQIWFVRYTWTQVKTLRIGSPTWILAQSSGQHVPDMVEEMLDDLLRFVGQMHPPSVVDALEANLMGTIDTAQYECWMRLNGHSPQVWRPVLEARREQLTTDEKIYFIRRADLGRYGAGPLAALVTTEEVAVEKTWIDDSVKSLRSVGWIKKTDAGQRESLYDELPTIADHLHWLARNVDDAEYVRDYHLLDGFDSAAIVSQVFTAEGEAYTPIPLSRNFWAEFGTELRAQGMRKIDAARHYAAHWLHPSPQQMHEFIYRLRPGRKASPWDQTVSQMFTDLGYPPELVTRATTFTADDFRRIMSEQDYGYLDVAWFLSTVYHVPALSYIRDMYRYNIIDDEQLAGYHQDLGYSALDSDRFVAVDRSIKARIRAAESAGWTPTALSSSFGLGLVTEKFYRDSMEGMGFSTKEIDNAVDRSSKLVKQRVLTRALSRVITRTVTQVSNSYAQGVLDEKSATDSLQSLGIPQQQAQAIVSMETLKAATKLSTEVTRVARSQYLKGAIDEDGVKTLLGSIKLADGFIAASLAAWSLEKLDMPKQAAISDIRRWVVEGLMGADEAKLRMTRLRIADPDQQLILAELQQKIEAMQAKEIAAKTKADEKALAAQQKAIKDAQRAVQQAIDKAKGQMPPSKLLKWTKEGVITPLQMATQLGVYGFSPEAITAWTAEATIASGQPPAGQQGQQKQQKPPRQKTLSEAEVKKLYKDGVIDAPEFQARLGAMGYSGRDISELAQDAGRPLP